MIQKILFGFRMSKKHNQRNKTFNKYCKTFNERYVYNSKILNQNNSNYYNESNIIEIPYLLISDYEVY
jgi:hypothetical protein